jgi:hypothetical protein
MYPSERITSPDPVPAPVAPFALILTTDGSTVSATVLTLHAIADELPDELDLRVSA